jgi:hypothetical protein
VALADLTWTLQVRVRYAPSAEAETLPDLCRVLGQAVRPLWGDAARSVRVTQAELVFGQEVVLRVGASPVVFVRPAA